MNRRRTDEDEKIAHFRSGRRIFNVNGQWFFSTRDGERGPYADESEAERELAVFLKLAETEALKSEFDADREEAQEPRPDPTVWDKYTLEG